MAARKKKDRVQQHVFSFKWAALPTPEIGVEFHCMCGNRWWGSDAAWVGCRDCHSLDDTITKPMSYKAACDENLYRVTTGAGGHGVREDGMVFAHSGRDYPDGWNKP